MKVITIKKSIEPFSYMPTEITDNALVAVEVGDRLVFIESSLRYIVNMGNGKDRDVLVLRPVHKLVKESSIKQSSTADTLIHLSKE